MSNIDKNRIPEWLHSVLKNILRYRERETLLGDFEEMYSRIHNENGEGRANLWYLYHILRLIPAIIYNTIYWSFIMFKKYFIVSLRNMKRQKAYTFINFFSLSIGLTSAILAFMFVRHELSYDTFHPDVDNTYRIILEHPVRFNQYRTIFAATPAPMGPDMLDEFPEVVNFSRYENGPGLIKIGNNNYDDVNFYYADPGFLEIFNFPLITGDPKTVLSEPFSVIITQEAAGKYFGGENPVGKIIKTNNDYEFTVTGILGDLPENTYFDFEFLTPFITIGRIRGENSLTDWGNISYELFIQLQNGFEPAELEEKLPEFKDNHGYGGNTKDYFMLQKITDVHLIDEAFEIGGNERIKSLFLYSAIAFFIMLIACFNYMNLSTAKFSFRIKEIGIRKVVGAKRAELIRQFLGESILLTMIAFVLSVFLVKLLLPLFNAHIEREIRFIWLFEPGLFVILIALAIFTGIAAGFYPAFYLSSFKPATVLKGSFSGAKTKSVSRNILVVIQYVISIILIISTLVVYDQLNFIQERDPGYERNQIITLRLRDRGIQREAFNNELRKNPDILDITMSSGIPSIMGGANLPSWEGQTEDEKETLFNRLNINDNFLDFYGIKIVKGRNFIRDRETDEAREYIINEAAVKTIGWDDPIGKEFQNGTVVGIVQDFNFLSMKIKVRPLGISLIGDSYSYLSIKITPENVTETLEYIENTWKQFSPNYPFAYSFIDDSLDRMYRTERKLGMSFTACAMIAILIASLGLFGLTSFTIEHKIKEIGIRKVIGATVPGIVYMLSKDFSKLVLVSAFAAFPAAWFIMDQWLQGFAYRTEIGLGIFITAALLAQLIALISVGMQTIKTALMNPVKSLRYE
ncbi:MAG: FtsX-like permease family protein [bacterium]|nr:FtsX-like permease family protein [bacterium]